MNTQDRSADRLAMPGSIPTDGDTDDGLVKLEAASEFFAGSLRTGDVFRLVASCLRDAIAAKFVVLYLQDETRRRLRLIGMEGRETTLAGGTFNADACLAKCAVHIAQDGVVAIPLFTELRPFGVIELHFDPDDLSRTVDRSIFETIGTRVAPLILNSLAFERSLSNALCDATTDLPNERALFLILEQQIAESQRKRDERPLTLLALDIQDFDEINQRFGYAAGDRVLDHVAQIVKDTLRQMDFLARCHDDEFVAVLPTASEEIAREVIARINAAFSGRRLDISDEERIDVALSVGSATFGVDGETAGQLIAAARRRKDQTKGAVTNKVLWFPKELAS